MLWIGELSHRTGVPAKTIRFYEEAGLLPPPKRAGNHYRVYDELDIERLTFIRRLRLLGFALDDIAEILAFQERGDPPCRRLLSSVGSCVGEIAARIDDLRCLREELADLVEAGRCLPEEVWMRSCAHHARQISDAQAQSGSSWDEPTA